MIIYLRMMREIGLDNKYDHLLEASHEYPVSSGSSKVVDGAHMVEEGPCSLHLVCNPRT